MSENKAITPEPAAPREYIHKEAERGQQWEPTTPIPAIQAEASPQAPAAAPAASSSSED